MAQAALYPGSSHFRLIPGKLHLYRHRGFRAGDGAIEGIALEGFVAGLADEALPIRGMRGSGEAPSTVSVRFVEDRVNPQP
jgi:hypothetical protein